MLSKGKGKATPWSASLSHSSATLGLNAEYFVHILQKLSPNVSVFCRRLLTYSPFDDQAFG